MQAFIHEFESSPNYVAHSMRPWVAGLHDPSAPWLGDLLFVGEPDDVGADLERWAGAADVDYVVFKMNWGVRDFRALREQLLRADRLRLRAAG
jgi:hypothetical protein